MDFELGQNWPLAEQMLVELDSPQSSSVFDEIDYSYFAPQLHPFQYFVQDPAQQDLTYNLPLDAAINYQPPPPPPPPQPRSFIADERYSPFIAPALPITTPALLTTSPSEELSRDVGCAAGNSENDTPITRRNTFPQTSRSSSIDSVDVTGSSDEDANRRQPSKAPPDVVSHQRRRHLRRQFSAELKWQTHQTRIQGACLWCWRNRKRCIKVSNGCCKYCVSQAADKIPNIPCFRSRLSSCELFRKGPTDQFCWTRRRWLKTAIDDSKVWRSPAQLIITVVQEGMGGLPLQLIVKQYKPLPDDHDTYTWIYGNNQHGYLKLPRYAIADIDGAHAAIDKYLTDHRDRYIEKVIGRNEIIPWATFQLAVRKSQEGSSLIRNALRLWTASRILEEPWQIAAGAEALGVQTCTDPYSPYRNKVPVTPVMDFQIDNITIHQILLPLRKKTLQDLQRKVLHHNKNSFLEIFLTMYIFLHNIELTIAHDRKFAQRYSLRSRFSHYELIEQVFLGANIMLTHFHYVTKGHVPFSSNWTGEETLKMAPDEANYMATVRAVIKHQAESLRRLRNTNQYDEPMFWCSQLFYDGWIPVVAPCA